MSDQELEAAEPRRELVEISVDSAIQVRDQAKRELDIRILPWDTVIRHQNGLEMFRRGAFAGIEPTKVVLRAPDVDGGHRGPITGRGRAIEERSDGAYMTFKVARTQAGDEQLALADDQVVTGASVGFMETPGGSSVMKTTSGRVRVHERVSLDHVITTWRPAYETAGVVAVRDSAEGVARMGEPVEAAPVAATEPAVPAGISIDLAPLEAAFGRFAEKIEDRIHSLEERTRSEIVVPSPNGVKRDIHKGHWAQTVLKLLTGERVSEIQTRALADLVTTDNAGVVPEAFLDELVGVIDPRRPFLNSTRRVPTPDSGMTLNVPVIATRPTAGVQVNEKDDITSTATSITNSGFDAVTIAGGGDISLQLLKRSSPAYLNLYLELLAEALSDNAEAEAIAALISAGVTAGTGTFDPEDLKLGEAWENAQAVKQRADTMWLSSAAVAEFLDAKDTGTNRPLYASLGGGFSVGGGADGGDVVRLKPVFVPALDATAVDVLIGPSRGFAWAEDGAFTLQVDVPAKAGRDVALVTIDWFAPLYPDAFTSYAL